MPKVGSEFDASIGSRVSKDTKRQLNEIAVRNYRTLSMQVRLILERYLDDELIQSENVKQKTTKRQDAREQVRST